MRTSHNLPDMNLFWWRTGLVLLLAAGTNAMTTATQLPVRLWTEVLNQGELWTVVPHVEAPAASALRYEILAKKVGHAGRSNTSQSGKLTVGAEGSSALSSLRIGVGPEDSCDVDVTVFSDTDVVAKLTLHLPR
jgi:hypothetical protein